MASLLMLCTSKSRTCSTPLVSLRCQSLAPPAVQSHTTSHRPRAFRIGPHASERLTLACAAAVFCSFEALCHCTGVSRRQHSVPSQRSSSRTLTRCLRCGRVGLRPLLCARAWLRHRGCSAHIPGASTGAALYPSPAQAPEQGRLCAGAGRGCFQLQEGSTHLEHPPPLA